MPPELQHVRTWIFDLDNTLYPASADLFGRIDARMTSYVARLLGIAPGEALKVQKRYLHEHGTTLAGLMAHHGVDARHFLDDVHAIELDGLAEDASLARAIADLPGRKLVFTNGDERYARRVLAKLGLDAHFEAVHDIHAWAYVPKPDPAAYTRFCERWQVEPASALFVEDMARNLRPAKAIGMTTVWLDNGSEQTLDADRSFVDITITDLGEWLHSLKDRA